MLKLYRKDVYDFLFNINTVLGDWQTISNTNNEFSGGEMNLSGGVLQCVPGIRMRTADITVKPRVTDLLPVSTAFTREGQTGMPLNLLYDICDIIVF